MSVIELNSPDWIVENLIQEMSRATVCRFRPSGSLADDTRLAARTKVQFTRDGVKLFAGVTLPAEITIAASGDDVVYTAADVLEYLGNNPCDEINSRYNRSLADSSIADDPTEETIETILDTEFGSLVGPGLLIGNIDYSDLPASVREYIPRDIETTGKTWIGLIDSVLRDIAVVAYWYDPSTIPDGDVIGGTLRLFDISGRNRSPAPVPTNAILPTRGENIAGSPEPNVIDCRITVDVSQTYDKLTFKGWGDLRERREKATSAWSSNPLNNGYFTTSNGFSTDAQPMRLNPADPNHARSLERTAMAEVSGMRCLRLPLFRGSRPAARAIRNGCADGIKCSTRSSMSKSFEKVRARLQTRICIADLSSRCLSKCLDTSGEQGRLLGEPKTARR
jgi:hypothetical protein